MRQHHYRGWSFSAWTFWAALFVGGTFYGAYRFDWFPIGVAPQHAANEQEPALQKAPIAETPPSHTPPDGRIEVAQSPGPQSEPTPAELDEPAPKTSTDLRSAKARQFLAQHDDGAGPKPKVTANSRTAATVESTSMDDLEVNRPAFSTDAASPKPSTKSAQIVRASNIVEVPETSRIDPALAARLEAVDRFIETNTANDLLQAHRELSTLYWSKPQWRRDIRERIEKTARAIYFDPRIHFMEPYVVRPNDQFAQFAKGYSVPWQYLAKLNHVDPKKIRAGQRLKVIKGPFSAIVELNNFLLTVHAYGYYVRAYSIGIGKDSSTPIGKLTVINKVPNPQYTDPQGRVIEADDPNNPLGKRWLDLGNSYGIHGTIDPGSIGKAESRGCVRMRNEDVEEVYDMLAVGSQVAIRR